MWRERERAILFKFSIDDVLSLDNSTFGDLIYRIVIKRIANELKIKDTANTARSALSRNESGRFGAINI